MMRCEVSSARKGGRWNYEKLGIEILACRGILLPVFLCRSRTKNDRFAEKGICRKTFEKGLVRQDLTGSHVTMI
jgi:hypothetical protein